MTRITAGRTLLLLLLLAAACPAQSRAEPLTNRPCDERGASAVRDGVKYYCVLDGAQGKQVWLPADEVMPPGHKLRR
jgi:hypothetical protein